MKSIYLSSNVVYEGGLLDRALNLNIWLQKAFSSQNTSSYHEFSLLLFCLHIWLFLKVTETSEYSYYRLICCQLDYITSSSWNLVASANLRIAETLRNNRTKKSTEQTQQKIKIEWAYAKGRTNKKTAKRLCVTNITGLLPACLLRMFN